MTELEQRVMDAWGELPRPTVENIQRKLNDEGYAISQTGVELTLVGLELLLP